MNTLKRIFNRLFGFTLTMLKAIFGTGEKKLNDLISEGKRVIEIDVQNIHFLSLLNSHKFNYLGISDAAGIENMKKKIIDKKLSKRLIDKKEYPTYQKNNADILILSGNSHELIIDCGNFLHVNYLLIDRRLFLKHFFKLIKPLIKHLLLLRITYIGVLRPDKGKIKYMVMKVLNPRKQRTRKYISPLIGVEGFFSRLNKEKINYAILRWFEDLPHIEPGEDIDMLVDDEGASRIEKILNEEPGLIPSDIYSVTGVPGFSYQSMAYYPPFLARDILNHTILYKDKYKVPNPEKHFLSLAYHAIFHKGFRSGIRSRDLSVVPYKNPEHDYSTILKMMAEENNYHVEITLEGIAEYLTKYDWAPPKDTQAKLASGNKWIKENIMKSAKVSQVGLVVFFIREKALELGLQDKINGQLKKEGFDILLTKKLSDHEKEYVSNRVRGGNWGAGPYKVSGGKPAVVIVAYDLIPQLPTKYQLKQYPNIDNAHVLVKGEIRNRINKTLPANEQCNMLHSSDNYEEAIDYISIAAPEYMGKINNSINELINKFKICKDYPVLKDLTQHGRRAKVEQISYNGQLAVKKTYRSNFIHYCQKEIYVMKHLKGKIQGIPDLLEYGENYFIVPFYQDSLRGKKRVSKLLPLDVSIDAMKILRGFYENGYSLLDFNPGNIIYDKKEGVKVIDFEFLYEYQDSEKPGSFEGCYDLAGIPEDFQGEMPNLGHISFRNYNNSWEKYVGLNLKSLLYDNYFIQYLKRLLYIGRKLPKRGLNKTYSFIGKKYGKFIILLRGRIS